MDITEETLKLGLGELFGGPLDGAIVITMNRDEISYNRQLYRKTWNRSTEHYMIYIYEYVGVGFPDISK